MGGFLTQPITTKQSNHGKGLGLRYGLSSMQGWRPEMEDAHDSQVGLNYGLHDWSFFAVFDGHAGKHTSCFASLHLLEHILKDQEFKLDSGFHDKNKSMTTDEKPVSVTGDAANDPKEEDKSIPIIEQSSDSKPSSPPDSEESITNKLSKKLNEKESNDEAKFASYPLSTQLDMVKRAIKSGFLRIDQVMRADRKDMSGSTAVCAFISPTHLFIANCGDSRAVLYDGTEPKFASIDHKPLNPTERTRIINAGGTATERVNGTLAVSRSLGDFEFKKNELRGPCEQLVSPEPEITVIERQPTDEFLILACDGIWDVMTNEELCEYVKYNLKIESNLETVCSNVLDVCLRKGSRDNMSIIIVVFDNSPKIDLELIEKVKKNDQTLLSELDSLMEEHPQEGFNDIIARMEDKVYQMEVFGLNVTPPGAGLKAKYDLLRERFDQNSPKFAPTTQDAEEQEKKDYWEN